MKSTRCWLSLVLAAVGFAALACAASEPDLNVPPSADCLKYEPEVVTLHGTVERRSFPGPPNYESVQQGDTEETYWFLGLDRPICMLAGTESEDVPLPRVTRVQLVLSDSDGYRRYRALLGQKVTASGTLFGAHTGHHHEPVLLTVTDLVPGRP